MVAKVMDYMQWCWHCTDCGVGVDGFEFESAARKEAEGHVCV